MFVSFAVCAALTTLCGAAPHVGFNTVVGDQTEARSADVFASDLFEIDRFPTYGLTKDGFDTVLPEYPSKLRKKRMAPIISKAVLALSKLLSKSKGVEPYTKYSKSYTKKGNFGSALQDFETFGPKVIKSKRTRAGVTIIEGQIESFKLKIRSPGYRRNADAILEITEYGTKKGDPNRTYNIMYMR